MNWTLIGIIGTLGLLVTGSGLAQLGKEVTKDNWESPELKESLNAEIISKDVGGTLLKNGVNIKSMTLKKGQVGMILVIDLTGTSEELIKKIFYDIRMRKGEYWDNKQYGNIIEYPIVDFGTEEELYYLITQDLIEIFARAEITTTTILPELDKNSLDGVKLI